MRHSTVIKSVLASIVILGLGTPVGQAQNIFFGMMSEQGASEYTSHPHEISAAQAQEDFKSMDLNNDGLVTREEFDAAYGDIYRDKSDMAWQEKRFHALDGNEDGKLTLSEYLANRNVAVDDDFAVNRVSNGARGDGN